MEKSLIEKRLIGWLNICYIGSVISLSLAANAAFSGVVSDDGKFEIWLVYFLPAIWSGAGGVWMILTSGKLDMRFKQVIRNIDFLSTSAGSISFAGNATTAPPPISKAIQEANESRAAIEEAIWRNEDERPLKELHPLCLGLMVLMPVIALAVAAVAKWMM